MGEEVFITIITGSFSGLLPIVGERQAWPLATNFFQVVF